ncbi:hypothetical protein JW964_13060 [candidate division KSB1 bacterium]|nr:hypothetical protein [candidate division KSB1 bacterium]
MEPIESVLNITLIFFILIVAATIIERLLEFVSILIEYFEPKLKLDKFWYFLAQKIQKAIVHQFEKLEARNPKTRQLVFNAIKAITYKRSTAPGEPIVLRIDFIRKVMLHVIMQVFGILMGILLAFLTHMNIFTMINTLEITEIRIPFVLGVLVTGILIGSGTSPVHSIIKYAEDRKESQKREAEIARLKNALNK